MPDANPTKFNVVEPDELLTAVIIPKPAAGTRSAYQKYGEKQSFDWAIADAGVVLEMDGDMCRRARCDDGRCVADRASLAAGGSRADGQADH